MADRPALVILTGAGISAESGLPTFRGAGGLWEGHRVEEVATPGAFARDPELVLRFYDARRRALSTVEPNPAHHALARLEAVWDGPFLLVTQNVDDLHERAGSKRLLHVHGELLRARCTICGWADRWTGDLLGVACPSCGRRPALRPDVVWFEEVPIGLERIEAALARCTLFAAIGTSGQVWPAAGFVDRARRAGAHTVELNLEPTDASDRFHEHRFGPASRVVAAWVEELTARR
ncbi:MAG: NAD-dependent protein deacylase [Geminicoccaceae bacterium]|nr:MAG: NAD-dependent protein deacylase [Geminicoccaceae bacterium]